MMMPMLVFWMLMCCTAVRAELGPRGSPMWMLWRAHTRRASRTVNHPPPAPRSATVVPSATWRASMTWSGFCQASRSGGSSNPRSWGANNRGFRGGAAGSCGTAAFLGKPVIVEDIALDPLWADYRDLALAHGKIDRIRSDDSVPLDNPFVGRGSAQSGYGRHDGADGTWR